MGYLTLFFITIWLGQLSFTRFASLRTCCEPYRVEPLPVGAKTSPL